MRLFGFFGRSRQFETRLADSRCRLWRLAYSWCGNRALADDLVQETLAKALSRHGQLRDPEALHGWLFSILAHCWHDHLRSGKEAIDIESLENEMLATSGCPEDDCLHNEVVRRVRTAVDRLPAGQREVVTLVDLEEFSYAEVASILAIPIGTVMSRLARARASLRMALAERQTTGSAVVRQLRS